jgi:F-type H+-transporting ATPase subunit delta
MPLVDKRYAEALVDMAIEGDAIDAYQQDLIPLIAVFDQKNEIKSFFLNPEINIENKKDLIKKSFNGKIRNELINFLLLLVDKGRFGHLSSIVNEFIILSDKKKSTINMTIVSANPLDEEQISEIKNKYIGLHKVNSAKVTLRLDESLIGGVKIIVGDKVVDGTVKGRLESLRQVLAND